MQIASILVLRRSSNFELGSDRDDLFDTRLSKHLRCHDVTRRLNAQRRVEAQRRAAFVTGKISTDVFNGASNARCRSSLHTMPSAVPQSGLRGT